MYLHYLHITTLHIHYYAHTLPYLHYYPTHLYLLLPYTFIPASYFLDSQGRRVRDGWIPHDQLIKVGEEERPPDETLDPRDYDEERQLPDGRTYFTSFPWAETA